MKSTKRCSGCRNDFYNGNNQYGISECWSVKDAKVVWGTKEYKWSVGNISKARLPNCWTGKDYIFYYDGKYDKALEAKHE